MEAKGKKEVYVKVSDQAGNLFVCPIEALKDIREASSAELENCIENAVLDRYAGNIDIKK